MKNLRYNSLLILIVFSFLVPLGSEAKIVVGINKKSKITKISKKQLKLLYYKRIRKIDNIVIEVRDQVDQNTKQAFYSTHLDKKLDEIKNYWAIQVFRGRKSPPIYIGTEDNEKMVTWLLKNINSMGYFDSRFIRPGIRVLKITK